MNLRRLLGLAAAFATVAAAAAVCVVAAAFAVYALAEIYLSPAGAAAVVAGVFALVAVIVAGMATRKAAPKPAAKAEEASLVDRAVVLARERPMIALGAGVAAAAAGITVLVRNPAILTAVVSAFLAGNASKTRK